MTVAVAMPTPACLEVVLAALIAGCTIAPPPISPTASRPPPIPIESPSATPIGPSPASVFNMADPFCRAIANVPDTHPARPADIATVAAEVGTYFRGLREAAPTGDHNVFDAAFEISYDWDEFSTDAAAVAWDQDATTELFKRDFGSDLVKESLLSLDSWVTNVCLHGSGPSDGRSPQPEPDPSLGETGGCLMAVLEDVESGLYTNAAGQYDHPIRRVEDCQQP
jgi:hypothetical protein